MNERDCLLMIHQKYGALLEASGARFSHRPEVLAGIMMRETQGGTSRLLVDADGVPDGNPADDIGDRGNGLGLMQIDKRYFPDFYQSGRWKQADQNIDVAALVLAAKRSYITKHLTSRLLGELELEKAAIAAYNCGEGNVVKAVDAGLDFDVYTTGRDYSQAVLRYAETYKTLIDAELS